MDFDEYDYLEKSVEIRESRNVSGKREGVEKSERGSRRRGDDDDVDQTTESRSKRSRGEVQNGERRERDDRERSSRSERRDKDRHRSGRDVERDNERDRDRGRERDRERGDREREKEKTRGKDRGKEMERDREKERERGKENKKSREGDDEKLMEREKEKEKEIEIDKEREGERERSRRSSSRSRKHQSDRDGNADREMTRGMSRDMEIGERERESETRESRRFKDKKDMVQPEADPERDQRTVFAYQMPLKATERDVYEFFSKAGKVRDVRLIMDRNSRRSKGVGYVEFYDAVSVPMAIALSGHQLLGQPVMVKPSEAEKNLVQSNASGGGSGGVAGPYGAVARKLYVGNLHFNMTEDQLRQVFEPFGPVELVQLPLDLETGQCKGFGFVQFAQLEHAKAAQSLNGKLDIAGRIIKVSAVTDHVGVQDVGANAADFDDDDGAGLSLNARSRAMLMQKLDRTGFATSIAGSLGVSVLNGSSAPNQQAAGLPMNGQAAVPASAFPALVAASPASEPIGNPSECLLIKNMFDPTTETDLDFDMDIKDEVQEECSNFGPVKHIHVDKNSAGYVYLRFGTVEAAVSAQRAMHLRWYARRLISALFMQPHEYEAKFRDGA